MFSLFYQRNAKESVISGFDPAFFQHGSGVLVGFPVIISIGRFLETLFLSFCSSYPSFFPLLLEGKDLAVCCLSSYTYTIKKRKEREREIRKKETQVRARAKMITNDEAHSNVLFPSRSARTEWTRKSSQEQFCIKKICYIT